ncbi:DegT/DnrJ/EryC1/StrS family aminotransferase [Roseivirga pacifica]|uniref:DegT/DnrJ/EryC1/StrS family aminotransferase n=1 Tax=Roseivirga pacifica TaxID=1267423 RepID=UPI0020946E25|nr:DegT/DnrJ/EryC1/StrS family aminotransferase [Roseivirga pacifica]MCO6360914.1 aminotransferase class I/II-fold pyridoxal phosphate-dependent enzyme [Roseivirga pacifica]MCO6368803.1 aminotransferase class I/II-fold pyridoxal phosphate-dependent enzyme [Roseivirga pacifica]MCO6372947.1 aminotransferase class I/II-fold pyridoxal phosphate-dependent enzyme [Roseivirga pacifica]MCO6377007.1 aminotransferase class I/II-fold pyridoxal phosphate-dependent enzyme [Roseivirga pacifica]MCO6377716.1 
MPGFEFFGEEERKEVNDVMESGVLMRYGFDPMRNGHWKAKELEQAITETFNVKHAQLTSSGTTALSTAMAVMGVGYGDEVIMPTFTFVASFEAIIAAGAVPVLADIDETLCLDPKAVEAAITPKTKMVMPVHMCGSMAQLDELKVICDKHSLLLLEDACQAIGGSFNGQMLGTIGHGGTFSFDFVKTITCGEGGAFLTNDEKYYINADHYTDHGHDHVGNDRGAESHPFLGYNFRISELHAAVGLGQIKKLDKILATQKKHNAIIKEALEKIEGITFRKIPDPEGDNASFLSFFLPTEELTRAAHKALLANGLGGNFYWYDNNWHYIKKWDHLKNGTSLFPINPALKEALEQQDFNNFKQSDDIMGRTISSLINLNWTEEQAKERAQKMAETIQSVL